MNVTLYTVLAVLMIGGGISCIYIVMRNSEGPIPQGGLQWAATVLSTLLVLFAGMLLALLLYMDQEEDAFASGINEQTADFAFTLVEDETPRQLSDFRGNVVLLNFWATWCQPCITELPELDRLQQDYASQRLVVITLSDEPREDLLRYSDLLPRETVSGYFEYDLLPQPFKGALETGRPISYIIDRDGYLRQNVVGAGNYDSFERLVKPYIDRSLATRG